MCGAQPAMRAHQDLDLNPSEALCSKCFSDAMESGFFARAAIGPVSIFSWCSLIRGLEG